VELKKASKNGLLRDACLASEKTNAHFMRVYKIISHQRYNKISPWYIYVWNWSSGSRARAVSVPEPGIPGHAVRGVDV